MKGQEVSEVKWIFVVAWSDEQGGAGQPGSTWAGTWLATSPGRKQVFECDSGLQSINPLKARFVALISFGAEGPAYC